jgi:chemotaxis methyl-accepting protein methylase
MKPIRNMRVWSAASATGKNADSAGLVDPDVLAGRAAVFANSNASGDSK